MSTELSPEVTGRVGTVDGLARRITAVYQDADDRLRQAVHDSLQAGMPGLHPSR